LSGRIWKDSPATDALALSLEALFPGLSTQTLQPVPSDELVPLSYSEDFKELWNLDRKSDGNLLHWTLSGDNQRPRTLVVVCDGSPPVSGDFSLDTRRYLTPYDWALAFSLAVFQEVTVRSVQNILEQCPSLRLLLLDLTDDYDGAFGHTILATISQALPWIQVYRSHEVTGTEIESVLTTDDASIPYFRTVVPAGSFGVDTMYADLTNLDRIHSLRQAQESRDRSPALEALKGLWKDSLIRPHDRHHIGNLIGPVLLVDALPTNLRTIALAKTPSDLASDALRLLVGVIGFNILPAASRSAIPKEGLLHRLHSSGDIFDRRTNIKFLLVDDRYNVGYQHVLGYSLFGDTYDPNGSVSNNDGWLFRSFYGELRCVGTPDHLLSALQKLPPINDWNAPRVFDLCDVLLLDLRLWARVEERRTFLEHLVGICDHLGANKINDAELRLALNQARRILEEPDLSESARNGNAVSEIDALALLPLLLSHYDPSIPIVLFSSTHQRAILDAVGHRPNIITDFAKPIFAGYGDDTNPERLGYHLKTAITKAVKLHESRHLWEIIATTDWRSNPTFELADPRNWNSMRVYNSSETNFAKRSDGKTRVSGGQWKPRLRGHDLKAKLAEYYVNYFENSRYFDFASIPWENLEGNLIPDSILNDPEISDPKFTLDPKLSPQNYVTELVRYVRNKKTHGHAPAPVNEEEVEHYRLASILAFMFFLDFLNNQDSVDTGHIRVDEMAGYLKMRYRHLRELGSTIKPRSLIDDTKVHWLDFVAYSACYLAEKAESRDKTKRFLSPKTLDAVRRLSQSLFGHHWLESRKLLPKGIKSGDSFRARVLAKTSHCFYVEAQQPIFLGSLPIARSCPHTKVGDLLNLVVSDCTGDVIEMSEDQVNDLSLHVRLGNMRRTPEEISNWFNPKPTEVRVKLSASGLYYAYSDFSTHSDAHRALKQLSRETRRVVEFAS
jgi:hypothetical protein